MLNILSVETLVDPLHDVESTVCLSLVVVAQPDQYTFGIFVNLPHSRNLQTLLFIIRLIYTKRIGPKPSHSSTMSELLKRCCEIECDWYNTTITAYVCSPCGVTPNVRDRLELILESPEGSNFEMAFQGVVGVAWMQHQYPDFEMLARRKWFMDLPWRLAAVNRSLAFAH
jgi:hypothetical protein